MGIIQRPGTWLYELRRDPFPTVYEHHTVAEDDVPDGLLRECSGECPDKHFDGYLLREISPTRRIAVYRYVTSTGAVEDVVRIINGLIKQPENTWVCVRP